ncbi:MAG: hypothetical protein JWN70_2233 [Planctomycetaceae bacterium]|nr:hypothetical protein [Planctomycetaceae bacterium]
MGDDQERKRRLGQLDESCERYVSFCGVICFFASFLLGWPALVAWVGLAWGMQQFRDAMRDGSNGQHSNKNTKPKKSNRRCCD